MNMDFNLADTENIHDALCYLIDTKIDWVRNNLYKVVSDVPNAEYTEEFKQSWQAREAIAECIDDMRDCESLILTEKKFDEEAADKYTKRYKEAKRFADFAIERLTLEFKL